MTRSLNAAVGVLLFAAVSICAPLKANAGSGYTDWDFAQQYPFSPFTVVQGSTRLKAFADCGGGASATGVYLPQPCYAGDDDFTTHPGDYLPIVFKLLQGNGVEKAGQMIVHATDPANGGNHGPLSIRFTAPSSGAAVISGHIYQTSFATLGRPQAWQAALNGKVLASGTNPDDGTITVANPQKFQLNAIKLKQGDVVSLEITEVGGLGTFMGVDLTVHIANP